MNNSAWTHGIKTAFIVGFADSASNLMLDPSKLYTMDAWQHTAVAGLVSGLLRVFLFLKTNPQPDDDSKLDISKVLGIGLAFFMFTGCVTTDTLPMITSGTELASGAVLQFAVKDTATRQEIANQMYGVAQAVRTLSGGQVPTVAQFKSTILSFTPKYPHWVDLSASLSSVYASNFSRIQGDPKLALEVLEAIAQGVENGAARIAPQPEAENGNPRT